ncbi:hypothetical protein [Bowmanella denitrificans]|uniref:hypothetical protein n=1 Tax=Bowmanella denitrificans TaxID=366582 RepID=UPI0015592972|nr:hypothetical protein [Bowmanella denitrificans]
MIFNRSKQSADSDFSTFFRTASSAEKKKVFSKVMQGANEMQRQVILASKQTKQA